MFITLKHFPRIPAMLGGYTTVSEAITLDTENINSLKQTARNNIVLTTHDGKEYLLDGNFPEIVRQVQVASGPRERFE